MADSNKVVLKINYQGKNKKLGKSNPPKMVTEWNIKRILLALIIVILIIFILYFISNQPFGLNIDKTISEKKQLHQLPSTSKLTSKIISPLTVKNNINQIDDINKQKTDEIDPVINTKQSITSVAENEFIDSTSSTTEIEITHNVINPVDDKVKESVEKKQKITVIKPTHNHYKNSRIPRALLTSGINNREPVDNIGNRFSLNNNKASKAYYFTEIINMKGKTLYHHWLWNGQTIFNRKIKILGNRWRASTSKIILSSQTGIWNVLLVDEEGIIFNEIQFDVIKGSSNN